MYTVEDAATRGGIGAVGLKRGGGAGVWMGGSPRDGSMASRIASRRQQNSTRRMGGVE